MANPFQTPTASDSGVDISDDACKQPASVEKEVLSPTNNTDKQVFDRTAESAKEVLQSPSSDTDKIFVPNLPPVSSDKEVQMPASDTDKQLSSTASNDSSPARPKVTPSHQFRVEKSTPMGLIMPQNQTLLLRSMNPTTKVDQGAAFVTNDMDWLDIMTANPPPFELFTAHDFSRSELVARFVLRSWQGITGMKGEFEVSCQGDRQKWEVVRRGLTRTYQLKGLLGMTGKEFVWKGSTRAVKEMVGDEKKNKGNLKLCTADGEVLAVWQQWRDSGTLGDVMIFEGAREKVAVEVVLTSCICVISAERANGLNWFGGLGKR